MDCARRAVCWGQPRQQGHFGRIEPVPDGVRAPGRLRHSDIKNCVLFDVSQFYREALVLGVGVDNLSRSSICKNRSCLCAR